MTNAERITELENRRFYLSMKDRWTTEDYALDRKWREEIETLRKAG